MNQRSDRDKISERIHRDGIRPAESNLLGSSQIRFMLGWVLSLGLLTLVVNLPIYPGNGQIGWQSTTPSNEIKLLPLPPKEKSAAEISGTPVTIFIQPEKVEEPNPKKDEKKEEKATTEEKPIRSLQKLARLDRGPILEFVDQSPAIVGGLSTLYLRIDYPKTARDQGIEGLTVLMFVVEKDGSTTDISVIKPLHPALDSSAVAAVRSTLFKPGRQDGKIVRVKMRLPIRFKLVRPEEMHNNIAADTLATSSDR